MAFFQIYLWSVVSILSLQIFDITYSYMDRGYVLSFRLYRITSTSFFKKYSRRCLQIFSLHNDRVQQVQPWSGIRLNFYVWRGQRSAGVRQHLLCGPWRLQHSGKSHPSYFPSECLSLPAQWLALPLVRVRAVSRGGAFFCTKKSHVGGSFFLTIFPKNLNICDLSYFPFRSLHLLVLLCPVSGSWPMTSSALRFLLHHRERLTGSNLHLLWHFVNDT